MPNEKTHDISSLMLAAVGVQLSAADSHSNNPVRTFTGVANSGKPFFHWGEQTIIDLDGIQFKDTIPALDGHDRAKRVGVAELAVTHEGLIVTGRLLTNEHGQAIANDADEGFPWELSVHAEPASTEFVESAQTVTVNGQDYQGPLVVLRACKIREVSFTPTGVDSQTEAAVLSGSTDQSTKNTNTKEQTMTLEEALAEIEKLKAENEQLKQQIADSEEKAKEAETEAKLSAAGFKKTDGGFDGISSSTLSVLLSVESDKVDAMIADLKANQPSPSTAVPAALLAETTPASGAMSTGKEGDALDKYLEQQGVY